MKQSLTGSFHKKLRFKLDKFVSLIYQLTKNFPKDELYGVTSQLRRSSLSIILNYIEGYGRMKSKVYQNFIEISYGSLKETKYLLYFSYKENYLSFDEYQTTIQLSEEIGAMLYGILKNIK